MNMDIFKKVEDAAKDYNACWNAAVSANNAAREIISAVKERIEAEKQQDHKRVEELKASCKDSSKSETVRKMARLELEQIQARNYKITEAESRALFMEIQNGKKAIADGAKLIPFMRDALWNATDELNRIKADTCGSSAKDFSLAAQWLGNTEKEAGNL